MCERSKINRFFFQQQVVITSETYRRIASCSFCSCHAQLYFETKLFVLACENTEIVLSISLEDARSMAFIVL
ncbi:unnamed protein product [Amoebophrya sp. A120]|nr:unnamed protein product [Amoebophrya sp. A120]|eukprot:GSA120T00008171001.1